MSEQLALIDSKVKPRAEDYGMVEIGRDEFFARIGPMNVHPSINGAWDDVLGYLTLWKTTSGDIVGKSIGGSHLSHPCYMVRPSQSVVTERTTE